MNMNQLAREISKHEGLKKQVDIAQIKEVLRVLTDLLLSPKSKALPAYLGHICKRLAKKK